MSEAAGMTAVKLRVPDMDCPSCLAKIERRLTRLDGVGSVQGSPVARTLTVELDPERISLPRITEAIDRLGYASEPAEEATRRDEPTDTWTGRQARIMYASMALFAAGLALRLAGVDRVVATLPLYDVRVPDLLFAASAFVGGSNFFPRGIRAARALALDMNFLMTVAILGALIIGETVEAAAIAFLFALAELLERFSVDRARASVAGLMKLAPESATVLRDGREVRVPASSLAIGDVVVLRPGERVPTDGRVLEGASAMDQSAITGESMPVEKREGDAVFAGAVNREGWVSLVVERRPGESTLARIAHLVEEAEARKTRSERFVERFARWYTPSVTVGALLVMTVPALAFGQPALPWVLRGLTLLVIACPCALVISTPVAVVSGVTAAARRGVLIKGGVYLEALGGVRAVALDKTGTLTWGHPSVVRVQPLDGIAAEAALAAAAAVESRSEHPLARAIVEAARERGVRSGAAVTDFVAVPGRGAIARLDGIEHRVGHPALLFDGASGRRPGQERLVAEWEAPEGNGTVVGVTQEGRLLAWITLADRPRDLAAEAVQRLRAGGVRHVAMLTGDHEATARPIAAALGVDEVRAALLPEDKLAAIQELEATHGAIVMVGDGVNDAPALAAATVGVAMGAAASDTALETADVALMGDDLRKLPYLFDLSRRARRVIRQNIAAALLVKAILAVGVPLGLVSLITAVLVGDMGVSLAVTLNALRLGRVDVERDH